MGVSSGRVSVTVPCWLVLLTMPLWIWIVPLYVAVVVLRGIVVGVRRGRRPRPRRRGPVRARIDGKPTDAPNVWRRGY